HTRTYTLSLHDALPISDPAPETVGLPELEGELPLSGTKRGRGRGLTTTPTARGAVDECPTAKETPQPAFRSHHDPEGTRWMVTKDRKSTRLNSSHRTIS